MNLNFGGAVGKLPHELIEILNQTYFLHLLATEPEIVIPSGKSLFSMVASTTLLRGRVEEPTPVLHDRVEKAIHSAFWNQALESLSNPIPSVQIARLKGLLFDVREAISPLFPPDHPIIVTLSAPVPPTASPLISTTLLLKEALTFLRQRAAPVRDKVVDGLLADLDASIAANPSSSVKTSTSQLALVIVNTTKSIVALADTMKTDLNQFVLGSMTESQLKDVVVEQAKKREKELVLDIWGDSGKDGRQRIQALWKTWVEELEVPQSSEVQPSGRDRWICRLVQSLGSTKAVSCTIPDLSDGGSTPDNTVGNQLPPQFFFAAPRLLYIQNYLQALVVAASLRSLTRLPPLTQNDSRGRDFMERVWMLLKGEIDDEDPSSTPTKIINFADEVVRARRLVSVPDEHEEAQLRAAVDRTLQYGDPVFLLLQKRLLAALTHQLCELSTVTAHHAPERMRTGRTLGTGRAEKRPRLMFDVDENEVDSARAVKGFEDPTLVRHFHDVSKKVYQHICWIDRVWTPDGV
ncbi:hypothetical protein C8R44DRAFT_644003 [Mycena epipterygia]|nr:hypothetical protein C8R44DRAFT_644003 [Mycena epipterygia]